MIPEEKEEEEAKKKEKKVREEELPKVKAKIESISSLGDVVIKFTEKMLPYDFELIDKKVLQLEIIPYEIPEGFDESKLAFTW